MSLERLASLVEALEMEYASVKLTDRSWDAFLRTALSMESQALSSEKLDQLIPKAFGKAIRTSDTIAGLAREAIHAVRLKHAFYSDDSPLTDRLSRLRSSSSFQNMCMLELDMYVRANMLERMCNSGQLTFQKGYIVG